jgi:hypothetical protein
MAKQSMATPVVDEVCCTPLAAAPLDEVWGATLDDHGLAFVGEDEIVVLVA